MSEPANTIPVSASVAKREIFSHTVNGKEYKCDPLALEIRFRTACHKIDIQDVMNRFLGPDWLRDEAALAAATQEMLKDVSNRRDEATLELIPVICEAFRVKTLDDDPENGWTMAEILGAFGAWQLYVANVKKNIDTSVESPPATDAPLPTQTPTTNVGSDFTIMPSTPPASAPYP